MGISDDIKPKKKFGYTKKPSNFSETKKVIFNTDEKPPVEEKDNLDDFFGGYVSDQKKPNIEPKNTQPKDELLRAPSFFKKVFLNKWLYYFLITALVISILLYNYPAIKALFLKDNSADESASLDTTSQTYESEIVPTDYTAEDDSSSAQDNSEEQPQTDLSSISIKVLNGNGVSGSAIEAKELLQQNGFTVSEVGNARLFSYQNTTIYYKSGKEAEATLVKDGLGKSGATLTLSDSIVGTFDIVVVVGKI